MNVICSIFNCSVHRYCRNAYLTTSSSSNEPLHQCDECGRRFFSRPKLSRHVRNVHGDRVFCLQCNYSVPKTRSYQLRKHEEIVHNKTKLSVEIKKSAYILPKTTTVRPPSPLYSDISSVTSIHREDPLDLSEWDFSGLSFPELLSFQDPLPSDGDKDNHLLATPKRVSTPDCVSANLSSSPIPCKYR